ncbi:uncharacterized protein LOC125032847 [Penaeus chinensis]|uniref:uncharacterized protein LOC125032847 n=1 Tax=Penaeus chinensis TaxID=139456 RepID=UPI001FB5F7E7|nr:uncharacterized protein LOC125032847 [Penaeus chinensis]
MSYSPTFLVFPEGHRGRTAFDQPQHHCYAPASNLCLHDKHGGLEVRDAFVCGPKESSEEVHAKGNANGVSCRFSEKPQPRSRHRPRQFPDGAERQDRRGILHRLFDCRREKDHQPRPPPQSGGHARQRGPDREGDSACLCLCDPPAPKRPFSLVDAAISPPASSAEPSWPSVPGWAAVPNSPTVPFWTGMPGSPIVPGWARTRPVPEGAEVERRNREVREVLTKRDARCNGRPKEQSAGSRRPCLVRRSSDLASRVEAASPGGSLSCTQTPTRGMKKFRSRLNVARGAGVTDALDRKSILRSMPNLDTILGHEDRLERKSARGAAMFISFDNDSLNNNNSNNNKNNNNNNHLNNNVECSWQELKAASRVATLDSFEISWFLAVQYRVQLHRGVACLSQCRVPSRAATLWSRDLGALGFQEHAQNHLHSARGRPMTATRCNDRRVSP